MRRPLTLLCLFSLFTLHISLFADGAKATSALDYRFVSLSNSQWMEKKNTDEVHREIDRIVAAGFNAITIGTYKFMPAYFIDYTKTPYPEAQQFTPEKSRAQLDTLRANIRYAKSKGIRLVVSRSMSHYCPLNYWRAHQAQLNPGGLFTRFLENAHQNDIYKESLERQKPEAVIPHQQWTNPAYRDFFLYSTERMLDLIPELDGFLNAYAEAAWTLDTEILRQDQWKNWKDPINYEATDKNFVDYANTLYALLKKKRGDKAFFGLRDWYVKPDVLAQLKMPPSQLFMAIKYAGFDQPLVNYPPWGKDLLDKGYSVLLDIIVFDAEHPHPVYWYNNDIIQKIFANMRQGGFSGVIYQDYQLKSKNGDALDHPIRLLTQKTVGAALASQPFTDADAIAMLRPNYGAASEPLLRSLKDVGLAQEMFIKLNPAWFWGGDGLTPGGLGGRRLWMLMDNPEALPGMAFVRQDAVSISDYVAATLAAPADRDARLEKWKTENKKTPPELMAEMRRLADESVTAALDARSKAPAKAPYMRDIVASAFIHQQLVERDNAFLESAIAFYRLGATWNGKYNNDKDAPLPTPAPGVDAVAEKSACLAAMQRLITHDQIMAQLLRNYAPRRPERRGFKGYPQEQTMAKILGVKLIEPKLDQTEYKRIEAQILGK